MGEAACGGERRGRVGDDPGPLAEGRIGGDRDGAPLVSRAPTGSRSALVSAWSFVAQARSSRIGRWCSSSRSAAAPRAGSRRATGGAGRGRWRARRARGGPFSIRPRPMAAARRLLPPPGGPSPATSAMTWALESVEGLGPGGRRASGSARAARTRAAGRSRALSERWRSPAHPCRRRGEARPDGLDPGRAPLAEQGRGRSRSWPQSGASGIGREARPEPGDVGRRALAAALVRLVEEPGVGGEGLEDGRAPERERVGDRARQMAVRSLDGAVLVRQAAVAARRGHPVVAAEPGAALGPTPLRLAVETTEGRGGSAEGPVDLRPDGREAAARVSKAGRQRRDALPAERDMDALEAAEGQAEAMEPVVEHGAGDGHAEAGRVGEVRQPEPARLVAPAEGARQARTRRSRVRRTPAPRSGWRRASSSRIATGHGTGRETGLRPGAASSRGTTSSWTSPSIGSGRRRPRGAFLVERARVALDPAARGRAEPGLGHGDGDRAGPTTRHEEPHPAIGRMAAGHGRSSRRTKHPSKRPTAITRRPTGGGSRHGAARTAPSPPSGPREPARAILPPPSASPR